MTFHATRESRWPWVLLAAGSAAFGLGTMLPLYALGGRTYGLGQAVSEAVVASHHAGRLLWTSEPPMHLLRLMDELCHSLVPYAFFATLFVLAVLVKTLAAPGRARSDLLVPYLAVGAAAPWIAIGLEGSGAPMGLGLYHVVFMPGAYLWAFGLSLLATAAVALHRVDRLARGL